VNASEVRFQLHGSQGQLLGALEHRSREEPIAECAGIPEHVHCREAAVCPPVAGIQRDALFE